MLEMVAPVLSFSVLPLVVATGAGAASRHSIGTGIIGGMIGATTLALFFVPLFYYLITRLRERKLAKAAAPRADSRKAAAGAEGSRSFMILKPIREMSPPMAERDRMAADTAVRVPSTGRRRLRLMGTS